MSVRNKVISTVGAAIASVCVGALPASANVCVTDTVGNYEAAGFSCTVDGLTFSNFAVNFTSSNGGSVVLGNFTPFSSVISGVLESGLSLTYQVLASARGSTADVAWTYNVTGSQPIVDAFLALSSIVTGTGTAAVSETLTNGVAFSLLAPGTTTVVFTPAQQTGSLGVLKDQINQAGDSGSVASSILTNAFSVAVPIPAAGAGLPGLVAACGALIAFARRRRTMAVAA